MKALLIGCVESSAVFLQTLLEVKADIVGVITKKESKCNADFTDLSGIAERNEIPYLYVANSNDRSAVDFIGNLKPDIGFCLGWSQLLKWEVLQMFPEGVIGFHPAALPQNRGRHPLIWALALGLEETASTFFMLDEGADTGRIVSQERILITYEDTARTLYDKVMDTAKQQLRILWGDICSGHIPVLECKGGGNTWRKRGRADGKIDWRMSGRNIYNLVRALSEPYVGAHFEYNESEYKVWEVRELDDDAYKNIEPGKILDIGSGKSFTVKTGSGLLEVVRYDQSFSPKIGTYL